MGVKTVVTVALGGAPISYLYKRASVYKSFKPNLIFLQSGIVDCAPRAFYENERKIIKWLGFSNAVKPFKKGIRKIRKCRFTSPENFTSHLISLKEYFNEADQIYALGILPVVNNYETKVPGIRNSVLLYNRLLKEKLPFIDNSDISENALLSDFHHLNTKGHQLIFNKLSLIIQSQMDISIKNER